MFTKVLTFGLIIVASAGAVLLGAGKLGYLKHLPKDFAKSMEDRAKSKIQPEKINFC